MRVIGRPLTPRALADLRPDAQAIADALVEGLIERVAIIHLTAPPVRKRNNLIRSFASLPVEVTT